MTTLLIILCIFSWLVLGFFSGLLGDYIFKEKMTVKSCIIMSCFGPVTTLLVLIVWILGKASLIGENLGSKVLFDFSKK